MPKNPRIKRVLLTGVIGLLAATSATGAFVIHNHSYHSSIISFAKINDDKSAGIQEAKDYDKTYNAQIPTNWNWLSTYYYKEYNKKHPNHRESLGEFIANAIHNDALYDKHEGHYANYWISNNGKNLVNEEEAKAKKTNSTHRYKANRGAFWPENAWKYHEAKLTIEDKSSVVPRSENEAINEAKKYNNKYGAKIPTTWAGLQGHYGTNAKPTQVYDAIRNDANGKETSPNSQTDTQMNDKYKNMPNSFWISSQGKDALTNAKKIAEKAYPSNKPYKLPSRDNDMPFWPENAWEYHEYKLAYKDKPKTQNINTQKNNNRKTINKNKPPKRDGNIDPQTSPAYSDADALKTAGNQKKLPYSGTVRTNRLRIGPAEAYYALTGHHGLNKESADPKVINATGGITYDNNWTATAETPSYPNDNGKLIGVPTIKGPGYHGANGLVSYPSVGGPDEPRILGKGTQHAILLGLLHEDAAWSMLQSNNDTPEKDLNGRSNIINFKHVGKYTNNQSQQLPDKTKYYDHKYPEMFIKLPKNQPNSNDSVTVKFPRQIIYNFTSNTNSNKTANCKNKNKKAQDSVSYITPIVTISHIKYYYPWYGTSRGNSSPRSLELSKNLFNGMKFNGVSSMEIHMKFKAQNTSNNDSTGHYVKRPSVPTYLKDQYGNDYKENGHRIRIVDDNGYITPSGLDNSFIAIRHLDGLASYRKHSNLGAFFLASISNEKHVQSLWTNKAFANGQFPNENSGSDIAHHGLKYWAHPYKKLSKKYVKSDKYYNGSVTMLKYFNGDANLFDPASLNKGILKLTHEPNDVHYGWRENPNARYDNTDPTGDSAQYEPDNGDDTQASTQGEYVTDKNSSVRTYNSEINPNGTATGGGFDVPDHSFRNNEVMFKYGNKGDALSKGSQDENTSNGVDPSVNFVTGSGTGYGNFVPKSSTYNERQNPKPNTKNCQVTPPKTQNPKLHKSVTKVHHATIDGNKGGILKYPNQKYHYKINGTMPTYGQKLAYKKSGNKTIHYDDKKDTFQLIDNLPTYPGSSNTPQITSTPYLKVGGTKVSANSGKSSHIVFKWNGGDNSKMLKFSNQPYTVIIPVKASKLPKINSQGWLKYINRTMINYNIHSGKNGSKSNPKHKKSNKVPVEIKKIKATIYHYDYNNQENIKDNYFPDKEQPFGFGGILGCSDSDFTKPTQSKNGCNFINPNNKNKASLDYKNYRFHKYFNTNKGVLKKQVKYRYVGSNFGEKFLGHKEKDGHKNWIYRAIYPGLTSGNMSSEKKFPSIEQKLSSDWCGGDKKRLADSYDGRHKVSVRVNPDCGNAYSKNNFTQTNYFPYIVPRINIPSIGKNPGNNNKNPKNNPYKPKDGRVIIDTDKKGHGLPFRVDMKVQNFLQGRHYFQDFKCDKIEMKITSNGVPLYDQSRKLVDKNANQSQHNEALAHLHNPYKQYNKGGEGFTKHDITKDEWPKGDSTWAGYVEKNAFKEAEARNNKYNLDTSKVNKEHGSIPIKVQFIPHNTCGQPIERIDAPSITSKAYLASDTKIKNSSFGNNNQKIYQEPERTIQYYGPGQLRVLKELFGITQPRNGYAKTGFGMTGNDFGMVYMGHLEAHQYATKGTSLDYAFPQDFNASDSNISYSKDPRGHTFNNKQMLVDQMIHIKPQEKRTDTNSKTFNNPKYDNNDGENDGLPDSLDNTKDDTNDVATDKYFDKSFPEGIDAGIYGSTYGFYPRMSYHNEKGIDQAGEGEVAIANHGDKGIYNYHKKFGDTPISNGILSGNRYSFETTGNHKQTTGNKHHYGSAESITDDGQNERMFTPKFMALGKYPVFFEKAFNNKKGGARVHRLGGNFFDIDEDRPVHFYAHEYIAKNSKSKDQDEFSLQPILTNPHGLSQVSKSSPLFPDNWLSSADSNNDVGNSWKSINMTNLDL